MENSEINIGLDVRRKKGSQNEVFPQFDKPEPVGYISIINGEPCTYESSDKQLRYFKHPPQESFPLDLNHGVVIKEHKDDTQIQVDEHHILKFICDNLQQFSTRDQMLNVEFIGDRKLLRLIMCAPYEYFKDWRIHVVRHRGTFYLRRRWTNRDVIMWRNRTEEHRNISARHHKFLQYCLTSNPLKDPDTNVPVDEGSSFNAVFRTSIDGLTLLYAAQIDGIISDKPIMLDENPNLVKNLRFIEIITKNADKVITPYKMREWWCHTLLAGIEDIYMGLREDNGLVVEMEHKKRRSLLYDNNRCWTGASCANFLSTFLSHIKKIMVDVDCPNTVFEFNFHPRHGRITYEIFKGKTEHSFLPDWYLDKLQS